MDRDLMKKLDEKFGDNFRITHYGADVIESFFKTKWFPELKGEYVKDEATSWQVKPKIDSILKVKDLIMPDVVDEKNYVLLKSDRAEYPDKAIFAFLISPLDRLLSLRLTENLFMDLYDYPDVAEDFLYRVGEHVATLAKKACELDVDVLYICGDICSSRGPLMSREFLEKYCFKPIQGAISEAKKAGIPVFYHTDGCVMDILDLFVKYGIDGINPLQPHVNDIRRFKADFGDKLLIYGGLDNCFKIPDGSVEDVKAHVRETFEVLGKNGGFIASTHDIPRYVPLENVDAMVETIKECIY